MNFKQADLVAYENAIKFFKQQDPITQREFIEELEEIKSQGTSLVPKDIIIKDLIRKSKQAIKDHEALENKCLELERKLAKTKYNKEFDKEVRKEVRKEELYRELREEIGVLKKRVRTLTKEMKVYRDFYVMHIND